MTPNAPRGRWLASANLLICKVFWPEAIRYLEEGHARGKAQQNLTMHCTRPCSAAAGGSPQEQVTRTCSIASDQADRYCMSVRFRTRPSGPVAIMYGPPRGCKRKVRARDSLRKCIRPLVEHSSWP